MPVPVINMCSLRRARALFLLVAIESLLITAATAGKSIRTPALGRIVLVADLDGPHAHLAELAAREVRRYTYASISTAPLLPIVRYTRAELGSALQDLKVDDTSGPTLLLVVSPAAAAAPNASLVAEHVARFCGSSGGAAHLDTSGWRPHTLDDAHVMAACDADQVRGPGGTVLLLGAAPKAVLYAAYAYAEEALGLVDPPTAAHVAHLTQPPPSPCVS